ncbi:MAG: prepilin-type N-terminal cleavage/methylation domain-containing protein [Lachnospiraceae bacterium]|nr:prepilin-type N-terminal cleavage/methylation domain-containing protein [Lachnospiraceae bacterium]
MKENRGLTLVELLVTIAILSIVLVIATSFMMTGSRSFAKGNADAQVQKEAELAVNQMEDMIIDVNGGVDMLKDDSTGDRELILYNAGGAGGVVEFTKESIIYKKTDEKIVCSKWNMKYDTASDTYSVDSAIYTDQLLAENVTEFEVDLSDIYKDTAEDGTEIDIVKSVQIKVGYKDSSGQASYATSPVITLRNRMMRSSNPTHIWHNTPKETDTLRLYISGSEIATVVPIQDGVTTVTRGNMYNVFAMINDGSNVNDLVDWEIGETNTLSTIDSSGKLTVGTYEPCTFLTITAKYKSNPSQKVSGVVRVEGGTLKSLDGVSITTKSLLPFAPQYGSMVSTIGFTESEIAALTYTWTVSAPERVESFNGTGKELALTVKQESENYGKSFTITLQVHSNITGQTVSDSIVYRIDNEGTVGGDSNMERGRTATDANDHAKNTYTLKPPVYEKVEMTPDYYFCDEYGNHISALDKYKPYVELKLLGDAYAESYTLTFTKDLPPDRPYYIKVIIHYHDLVGENNWKYERIHYIQQLRIQGETTYITEAANLYDGFYTNYSIVGYYNIAWVNVQPVNYEVTLDYEAPAGVVIGANVIQTETAGDEGRLWARFLFDVDTGGMEFWKVAQETKVKSATIKISHKDYPSIYTYSTVIFP